ncbi:5-amino-6-(5-phosphoribosylamino)uracil reductase [Crossiella equi]|uniref:5-amino-6-(5-phosphoribosylamino)uracil reductase n=1 Tax=Crossiella equi TaxID=130796 RepID=A0ABS5AB44_9PSEU|nr:pyrimidine reductase family protein [Crossiella equi]MBP2473424.1 5-amino-6-(5-phosphoribosylamino)uracil reductase [Crossiella equi]
MDSSWDAADNNLEVTYAFPAELDRPWVRVNFVSSVDGAVTAEGRSRGLSTPMDHKIFLLSRDLADVVLVGLRTAQIEGYAGFKTNPERADRRARLGLEAVPPIALLTRSCALEPESPLLTDSLVPPIVFTTAAAPAERRTALTGAGAEVVLVGEDEVELPRVLAELDARGMRRVDCEGGPTLFGSLIAEDLVDELCLTLSPLLAAGDAARIAHGAHPDAPRALTLASVLHEDGALFLRYLRAPR